MHLWLQVMGRERFRLHRPRFHPSINRPPRKARCRSKGNHGDQESGGHGQNHGKDRFQRGGKPLFPWLTMSRRSLTSTSPAGRRRPTRPAPTVDRRISRQLPRVRRRPNPVIRSFRPCLIQNRLGLYVTRPCMAVGHGWSPAHAILACSGYGNN